MHRSAIFGFVFACFVGFVWINQGSSAARVDARIAELDPAHSSVDAAHRILLNVYKRSVDEEIYFAVARAMRGLPYDAHRLTYRGHGSPSWFSRAPPADGAWHAPYVEVPVEYPLANLPLVLVPSFGAADFEAYARRFAVLAAMLLFVAAWLVIRATPGRDGAERWWSFGALLFAEGALTVARLDALPALLLAWALWAAAERRQGAMGVALGLATAVKFMPALLVLPLVAADRGAWDTARARRRGALGFAGALAVGLGPIVAFPGALRELIGYHSARGLEVESTYATVLGTWRLLWGTGAPATYSYGSNNLDGPVAGALARVAMPLTLLCVAALVLYLFRTEAVSDGARRDRLALTILLGTCALWLAGKVFSPQYLTWGIPLVLGVSGNLGRRLTVCFFFVLLVTQIYLCGHYEAVVSQVPLGVGSLDVRLAVLVLFAALAAKGLAATSTRSPTPT